MYVEKSGGKHRPVVDYPDRSRLLDGKEPSTAVIRHLQIDRAVESIDKRIEPYVWFLLLRRRHHHHAAFHARALIGPRRAPSGERARYGNRQRKNRDARERLQWKGSHGRNPRLQVL